MATRLLYISGTSGAMLIGTADIDASAAATNPMGYRDKLYFHAGLPYLQLHHKITPGDQTFPAKARGVTTWEDGSKGCGGGCFITTACVKYLGLGDDCHELTVLRKFRDEFMLSHENGIKLAELYYSTAPEIVERLESLENSETVFKILYTDYIVPSVSAIESGNNELALSIYIAGYSKAREESGIDNGISIHSES